MWVITIDHVGYKALGFPFVMLLVNQASSEVVAVARITPKAYAKQLDEYTDPALDEVKNLLLLNQK